MLNVSLNSNQPTSLDHLLSVHLTYFVSMHIAEQDIAILALTVLYISNRTRSIAANWSVAGLKPDGVVTYFKGAVA